MGKLIALKQIGFFAFLFLFAFSVALDFEYNITYISGSGEVLGQGNILVGDTLQKVYAVPIPIKLHDLVTLAVIMFLIVRWKYISSYIQAITWDSRLMSLIGAGGLFFLWLTISILLNSEEYTRPQLYLMWLHLVKLVQVIFIGVVAALLIRGCDIREVTSPLLFGFFLASSILVLNKFGWIQMGATVGDRMETFGSITIGIFVALFFYEVEAQEGEISGPKKILFAVTILFSVLAILISGKRGVMVAFLVSIAFIMIRYFHVKKTISGNLNYWIVAGLIISLPSIMSDFQRTTGLSANSLHGTIYREDIIRLYAQIQRVLGNIQDLNEEGGISITSELRIPIISSLDYSGVERIGKIIKSFNLSAENIWIGSGFWGTQYKHSFLPDSGMQVLLECGLVGVALLLLSIYLMWIFVAKNYLLSSFYLATLALLTSISLFCNPFYMSRLMMIWIFFCVLTCSIKLKNKQK